MLSVPLARKSVDPLKQCAIMHRPYDVLDGM